MGNQLCCQAPRPQLKTVTHLANNVPDNDKYILTENQSIRFSEVSCRKSQKNTYLFTMSIKNEVDIHAEIPVINQLSDCFRTENYQLKFGSRAIVDIFNKKYTGTVLEAKNQKTSLQYSVKIMPFKSYTSKQFKKSLYQLWLNQKLGYQSHSNVVKLIDYFIYGMLPDMQVFVLLFQKCTTNLANVAEYRKQSGLKWSQQQKIKVFAEVMESYHNLVNKNIIHRDLRPNNVFYAETSGKFVIGNLTNSRLLRRTLEDDLISVCGVSAFSCDEVVGLINKQQSIGYYQGIKQDYQGLKSILNILETCQIYNENPQYSDKQFKKISHMLDNNQNFQDILKFVNMEIGKKSVDTSAEIGDKQIANTCSYLLAHTHKNQIQKYKFETFAYLGYNKQFSGKAHQILESNNQTDNQLQNAPILKRLGQFYESKGAKGTQYHYNAFSLYLIRAEKQLKYGYPDKAEQQLDDARQVYLKFSQYIESQMPRIQMNRISALVQDDKNNKSEARTIIDSAFVRAAQQNLPIQKQCKILLAYGQVYKSSNDKRQQALKKLITGLAICENSAAFQSPTSCRIFKSNFLFAIGSLHMDQILTQHDPRKHRNQQPYGVQLKAKAQTHIKSALQIRQRQIVDDIDIAECLIQLGYFYYNDQSFYDSKKYFQRALIRLNQLSGKVNPMKIINTCYMKGSSSYYLNQYDGAYRDYDNCLRMLDKIADKRTKQLLSYNIEGNLGLAKMQLGQPDGRQILQSAMQKIKELQGQYSYDYACLRVNYRKINSNQAHNF